MGDLAALLLEGPSMRQTSPFDEDEYLRLYPDIADAIAAGQVLCGKDHYFAHGRAEGRQGFKFDETWYAQSYPLAVQEVERGAAASLQEHFEKLGQFRGYLPHNAGARPDNPTAIPSRFGGTWVDQPNARDIVAGRVEIGLINGRQAEQLLQFIDQGYVVLGGVIADEVLERALGDHDAAYAGKFEQVLFECPAVVKGNAPWRPEYTDRPAKALDLHWFSPAIRDLIFSPRVAEFLGLLFDAPPFASQSLCFHRGSAQEGHQDSAFVPYTLQRSFAASWIALEDVEAGAGELFYRVGSHRLEEFLYADRYKSVAEAKRYGALPDANAEVTRHVESLIPRADEMGAPERTFIAKRGDVLIWHADLVHGGKPISLTRSRRSVVTHYCSKFSAPLFAEATKTSFEKHGPGYYTSSYYGGTPTT
jgi:phytanoyl-CoA hydroxylase